MATDPGVLSQLVGAAQKPLGVRIWVHTGQKGTWSLWKTPFCSFQAPRIQGTALGVLGSLRTTMELGGILCLWLTRLVWKGLRTHCHSFLCKKCQLLHVYPSGSVF